MKVPTEAVLKSRLERGRWDSEVRRWERLRGVSRCVWLVRLRVREEKGVENGGLGAWSK